MALMHVGLWVMLILVMLLLMTIAYCAGKGGR